MTDVVKILDRLALNSDTYREYMREISTSNAICIFCINLVIDLHKEVKLWFLNRLSTFFIFINLTFWR